MKTSFTHYSLLLAAAAAFFTLSPRAEAQRNAQEAAEMLRGLNIQIAEAGRAGNRERVSQLQNRYLDIQKKWGVQPAGTKKPVPPPVKPSNTWSSARAGTGKITGYRGGPVRVQRASVSIANFWYDLDDKTPNQSGRGAVLKFTDAGGTVYSYSGNWTWRGNRAVSLRVGDGEGGVYTGTLTMAPQSGIATISLVGQGEAEGYNVTFAD